MPIAVTTHLNFRSEARAAPRFYQSIFGGDLALITYEDARVPVPESEKDHVMWGQVSSRDGFSIMAFDVPSHLPFARGDNSFYVSIRYANQDDLTRHWAGLSEGAAIRQPLGPSGWSVLYGMLEDRFGIVWVLDAVTEVAGS